MIALKHLAALVGVALLAQSGPKITVRGMTRLDLEKIQREGTGVIITVRLVDSDLDQGIADKIVQLRIKSTSVTRVGTTNKEGRAQIRVPYQSGRYDLRLGFAGDAHYLAANPILSKVDLSKEAVNLSISTPPVVDARGRPFQVTVVAKHSSLVPSEISVALAVKRGGKTVQLLRSVTDRRGRARFRLTPAALGPAGEYLLEARSTASRQFNPARTEQRLVLRSKVVITLSLGSRSARKGKSVELSGTVQDLSGPVPDGVVHLMSGKKRLAVARTDAVGRYHITLGLARQPLGPLQLQSQFVPRTAWRQAARSPVVTLQIVPPKPIPLIYYLIPAAATLLFLLALLVIRKRPWEAWKARLAERRQTATAERQETGGIELGRRRSFRALFSVDDRTLSGLVLDAHEKRPLGYATVYLRPSSFRREERQEEADDRGEFVITDVSEGTYNLVITAPGYIPQSLMVEVPHRGELRGMTIRLVSVRVQVMHIYTTVIQPLLPDPDRPHIWTPAEATSHILLKSSVPPPGLTALTALTERVYYSGEVPELDRIDEATQLAEAARATPQSDSPEESPGS